MQKIILVVEDEVAIREVLVAIINDEDDYKGVGAENGLKALELLKTITFDLITLDMNMPEMDGNAFLKELSKAAPSIPVIVITAAPKELKSHSQVKALLTKPFDIEHIISAVEKHT